MPKARSKKRHPVQKPRATITVMEAARRLGISRNTAYDAARAGQLPHLKIGKRILILAAPFERLLTSAGG